MQVKDEDEITPEIQDANQLGKSQEKKLLVVDKSKAYLKEDDLESRRTYQTMNAKEAEALRNEGVLTIPPEDEKSNCRSKQAILTKAILTKAILTNLTPTLLTHACVCL